MAYHHFEDEEGNKYGSFETFYLAADDKSWENRPGDSAFTGPGWYWWSCYPGCLPDSDPVGPFETEEEAVKSAQGVPY